VIEGDGDPVNQLVACWQMTGALASTGEAISIPAATTFEFDEDGKIVRAVDFFYAKLLSKIVPLRHHPPVHSLTLTHIPMHA
jgi:hypothetical protein